MAEPAPSTARYALPRDTLVARGPDRKTWLDGLVTCQVTAVSPGAAAYGLLLTKQGKIVSDVFLADDGEQLFIGVAPGQGPSAQELLDRYLVMEDAELSRPEVAPAWLLLAGSSSSSSGAEPGLAQGTLRLGTLACALEVSRSAAGVAPPAELRAWLAQHGLGSFGVDFDQRDNPHEASLDRIAVSWTKGCYLGQEVVCMQDMRGKVKRRLVALSGGAELLSLLHGAAPATATDVLAADGASVGHVTSAHAAPSGETWLLASLASSALESQSALTVLGQPVRVVEAREPLLS
jgi:folate-binding protein YgfZ